MYLETERLIIRRPKPEDVEDILQFRNSEFVLKYNCMRIYSREDIISRILPDPHALAIVKKETGKVIGMISVEDDSVRSPSIPSKELSYYLCEQETRKGYMREALQAVIRHLFTQENMECIGVRVFTDNEASNRLALALGFHKEGVVRRCVKAYKDVIYDDTLYSLLREEFGTE